MTDIMEKEKRLVQRNEVLLVNFGEPFGAEQAFTRPAIVVQENLANMSSPATIVVPLTSNLAARHLPSNVFLMPEKNGLTKQSIALTNQIRMIDKKRIKKSLGFLSDADMERLDNALRQILALD